MPSRSRLWSVAVWLSLAALLSFLTRTFIDYGFVYEELNLSTSGLGLTTVFNLALFGAWISALLAASHLSRRGMLVLAALDSLTVAFGLTTLVAFCPSPCPTAWPVGEIAVWSNLAIGIPATLCAVGNLLQKRQ